jgi:hypothetical protein
MEEKWTHRLAVFAEEFTTDTPEMIAIGTCCQCSIGTPAWGTLHQFLGDRMCSFPLPSHLLIARLASDASIAIKGQYLVEYPLEILIIILIRKIHP